MTYEQFLKPREVKIGDREFTISKIPAMKAHGIYGRIIRSCADLGDLGMTMLPNDIARELFEYVAVKMPAGCWVVLDTEDAINNNLPELFDLISLQVEMVNYNFGFFKDGSLIKLLGLPAASKQSR